MTLILLYLILDAASCGSYITNHPALTILPAGLFAGLGQLYKLWVPCHLEYVVSVMLLLSRPQQARIVCLRRLFETFYGAADDLQLVLGGSMLVM